ncbi:MAG: ATP-binding protein [Kiritimatiellae bacterium]|nr:ATP-binding protein [Kiritimatiellia bacterium]
MAIENFRSRARVIDLLGRQQIADAPTATGELFKNALDAGARRVQVDYFDADHSNGIGFLSIHDDGLGMRCKEDVVGKWLVLATESKFAKKEDDGWTEFATPEQKEWLKTTYGEKGIGRLSVASLGRMTVLWSVWGEGSKKRGTLCIVHWHLFRHPTKLLTDLPIPCAEFDHGPSPEEFETVFSSLRQSPLVDGILHDETWDESLRRELQSDITIPSEQILSQLKCDFEMGTTFLCVHTNEDLRDLFRTSPVRTDELEDASAYELKSVNAFSSFWDPFHSEEVRPFRIEVFKNGTPVRKDKKYRYWSPDDFEKCDHHIRIEVSENGFAKGYIANYQSEKIRYSRQLKRLPLGMRTPGRFLIEIGYVQGTAAISFLPPDLHRQMDMRLQYAGGFSIYKGGVHVQPYGAPDSDFAGFEQRRLKNAGRYYFSHLRMFGGVFLPADSNQIKEKAGREGFIVNGASRGLRFWLEDVFVDIADRFLGRKADREDKRRLREEKKKAAAQARLEREKEEYQTRIRYARGWLDNFKETIVVAVRHSRQLLNRTMNAISAEGLHECEVAIEKLREYLNELQTSVAEPPDGVVICGDAWEIITDYISKRAVQITNLQGEIAREEQDFQKMAAHVRPMKERERHFLVRLQNVDELVRKRISNLVAEPFKQVEKLSPALNDYVEREIGNLKLVRDNYLNGLTPRIVAADCSGQAVEIFEMAIQAEVDELESNVLPRLKTLCANLQHLTDGENGVFVLSDQTRELQMLREQHSHIVTAAQLGLVFETATHEYEKQVDIVRDTIQKLSKRLSGEDLTRLQALKDSFGIIEERIRLMDPLIRRRSSKSESLTGSQIEDFLKRRFVKELELVYGEFTDSFKLAQWSGLNRPVFLGAIHNLFINSLYWAKQGTLIPAVRLSVSANGSLVLSDSGPGVSKMDAPYIFEPGFSRRPGGQGLGLYIARESLKEFGFDLILADEPELGGLTGANFVLSKIL